MKNKLNYSLSLTPQTAAGHSLLAMFFGVIASMQVITTSRDLDTVIVLQLAMLIAVMLLLGFFAFSRRKKMRTKKYAMYISLISIPFLFFAWLFPAVQIIFGNYSLNLSAFNTYQIFIIIMGIFQFGRLCVILLISSYLKIIRKNKNITIEHGLAPSSKIISLPEARFLGIATLCGLTSYFLINNTLMFKYLGALTIGTLVLDLLERFKKSGT